MILVAYDGSLDADAAIDRVARLRPGAEATVLTVWEPLGTYARTGPMGSAGSWANVETIDAASEAQAEGRARAGADRAAAAGLVAATQTARSADAVGLTILSVARDLDADLLVVGTRGQGGLRSFLLGSVSHAIVQHADRPVLVVPSPALAERRLGHRRSDAVAA